MTSRIGSRPAIPVVTIVELFRFAAAGSEIVVVVTVAIGMTIRSIEPPALIPAMPFARGANHRVFRGTPVGGRMLLPHDHEPTHARATCVAGAFDGMMAADEPLGAPIMRDTIIHLVAALLRIGASARSIAPAATAR